MKCLHSYFSYDYTKYVQKKILCKISGSDVNVQVSVHKNIKLMFHSKTRLSISLFKLTFSISIFFLIYTLFIRIVCSVDVLFSKMKNHS